MPPKPRTTIPRPPAPTTSRPASTAPTAPAPPPPRTRRRRYVSSPASLCLLLVLHALSHLLCFLLLTEPCLNPSYTNRLRSKLDYFSLLSTPAAIPAAEWGERFTNAGVRGLFGVGVIQAWFVARLNAYVQRSQVEHRRLVAALKRQREQGGKVGVDTRWQKEEESEKVGSFIRQLEGVSVTFLALPLMTAGVYGALWAMGAEIGEKWKQTGVVAVHLALLVVLPVVHILGLPDVELATEAAATSNTAAAATTSTSPPTSTTNTNSNPPSTSPTAPSHWTSLLTLHPNPSYLLPLFYPPLFCLLATLLSTSILALDWNVSYQTYPFPLLVGSLLGVALGDVFTVGIVLFG